MSLCTLYLQIPPKTCTFSCLSAIHQLDDDAQIFAIVIATLRLTAFGALPTDLDSSYECSSPPILTCNDSSNGFGINEDSNDDDDDDNADDQDGDDDDDES